MSRTPARLGDAHVTRAGERLLALANSSWNSAVHTAAMLVRLFRRDAETNTRDACATHI